MRHPPFKPGPAAGASDFHTKAGAERLAATIRDAWARCGHDVPTVLERMNDKWGKDTYCVRMPSLVNGLPR